MKSKLPNVTASFKGVFSEVSIPLEGFPSRIFDLSVAEDVSFRFLHNALLDATKSNNLKQPNYKRRKHFFSLNGQNSDLCEQSRNLVKFKCLTVGHACYNQCIEQCRVFRASI